MFRSGAVPKAVSAAVVIVACVSAQQISVQAKREVATRSVFSAGSQLVLIPVTVTDRYGASITGLTQDKFSVWEGKTAQPIVSFGAQDAPCTVGIVLDTSGSMRSPLRVAKEVITAFLRESNAEDEFFMLTVGSHPQIQSGLTDNPELIETALRSAKAGGSTALIDTIYLALDHLKSARHPHRALLVVSDGADNHSRYTAQELFNVASEADAQIYTISVNEPLVNKKPVAAIEDKHGIAFMTTLAERTGGLNFEAPDPSQAARAAADAGVALRNQYVLGVKPEIADSGKWHRIKVRVSIPNAAISARNGYRSP
jgi:Ca-activated chloride channel family protein